VKGFRLEVLSKFTLSVIKAGGSYVHYLKQYGLAGYTAT
jgi:hypothetical protein